MSIKNARAIYEEIVSRIEVNKKKHKKFSRKI